MYILYIYNIYRYKCICHHDHGEMHCDPTRTGACHRSSCNLAELDYACITGKGIPFKTLEDQADHTTVGLQFLLQLCLTQQSPRCFCQS